MGVLLDSGGHGCFLLAAAGALLDVTQSRFTCRGDSAETRQCVLHNVIITEGVIWLYRKDSPTVVPPMMCSTANIPVPFLTLCQIHVVTDVAEFVKLLGKTSSTPRFDVGVALHRLNPSNAYHSIFEDMIPAAAMLGLVGNLSIDPAVTLHRLQERRWGLFVVDSRSGDLSDRKLWRDFLPEIAMVQSSDLAYRVDKLHAGTQALGPLPTFGPTNGRVQSSRGGAGVAPARVSPVQH